MLIARAHSRSGDGVLDIGEFVDLVATSAVLRPVFGDLIASAKERRDRDEFERMASIFRNPAELRTALSPSGRRRRPNLHDLRSVQEMSLQWHKEPVATALEPFNASLAYSPPREKRAHLMSASRRPSAL